MKPSKNLSELCYSHIYEASRLCDYEVLTDELSAQLGMAYSAAEADALLTASLPELLPELARLQELALHANGSVRGKLAVTETDLDWLHMRYERVQETINAQEPHRLKNFVLPRGLAPVPELHQARSTAKKAIRCLTRVAQERSKGENEKDSEKENRRGIPRTIPPEIPRFLNLLCNHCFLLTVLINQCRGTSEPVFVSQSYRVKPRS